MNTLEIVVAIICVIGIIYGLVRGSLKTAMSIITTVAVIAGSVYLVPYVAKAIEKYTPLGTIVQKQYEEIMVAAAEENHKQEQDVVLTYAAVEKVLDAAGIADEDLEEFGISIADIIQGNVTKQELSDYGISSNLLVGLYKAAEGTEGNFDPAEWADSLSTSKQYAVVEEADIIPSYKRLLNENNLKSTYERLGTENFLHYAGLYMGRLFVNLTAFFFIFLLAGVVIRAFVFALDIITGLPSKGIINRLIGGIFGIADVLLIIWLLMIALDMFATTTYGRVIYDMVQDGKYIKILYDANPVWEYIVKML